ncbi:hypothetical protein KHQ81_14060 [Mycoplasmatota bacterium]|nr:hypothetical protein KHQ81_14060 [Mycoplasmatota bacterium]
MFLVQFLAKDFHETLLFGWVFGGISLIYLLLPRKVWYFLLRTQKNIDEWEEDVKSLGTRKHHIEVNYEKSYTVGKIAAFILLLYCVFIIVRNS